MDLSTQYRQQQTYDPSQVQTYDQSTQAYYEFHQYNQYLQQQQYPYYTQDYSNAYQQQQSQQEPTLIHPPGVPIAPESTHTLGAQQGLGQTHLQNQPNPYYPQEVANQQPPQQQQLLDSSAGMNPAALPQFAGNTNSGGFGPIGQTPYTGGGRRGGRLFRGGGPGRGSGPPFRGRGRGRGRGGHFMAPANKPAAFVQGESSGTGQAPHTPPVWPPPRTAWCELCRVDCNTLDILEQHKNGKRHKKNLQVYEELQQKINCFLDGGQSEQMLVAEGKQEVPIQPEKVEGAEDKQPPQENLASQAVTENKVDTEQKKVSEEAASTEGRGVGFKRKMRGGRGGKWMRTYEGSRRPVEPPKPKQVIPLVCELCNVKCDSQVVFDSHLTGKKHLANTKRFQGHQAMLGQAALQALYPALQALYPALQALYPPNPDASISFGPQFHQGVHDSQGLFTQLAPLLFPPGQASAPVLGSTSASAQPSVLANQDHQDPKPERSQVTSEAGSQDAVTVEAKSQQQPVSDSQ